MFSHEVTNISGTTFVGHQANAPKVLVALIKEMLPHERFTIGCVAAQLDVSVRTLQRRLEDCGLSFKALVDDIRRSVAIQLVLAGEHAATEITFMLGYSDQAHFTRAFKRWTGMPPRQFATCRPC
jgi:AraC-like DNA-binding protein